MSFAPGTAVQPGPVRGSRGARTRRSVCMTVLASASAHGPASPPASARSRPRRSENVPGAYWVDSTCIDCDTCRWMAPEVFGRSNGQSAVHAQPQGYAHRVRALQALLSCPTFSIHADDRTPNELKEAQQGLPAPIPGVPGVWHCGWHSESSFAATSYLLAHPAGNIMVDTPRFNPVLARQLEALGGVSYIFLTHKDDVGDHAKWAKHFNAVRILHKGEVRRNTADVEIQLEGEGPWSWSQDVLRHPANHHTHQARATPATPAAQPHTSAAHPPPSLSHAGADQRDPAANGAKPSPSPEDDITLVFTPGHTTHHVCLYHPPSKTLFSGDHLSSPEENGQSDRLNVFKDFNWYSFPTQLESVRKLLDYDWLHVLPGHGRQAHLRDAAHRLQAVHDVLAEHGAITAQRE